MYVTEKIKVSIQGYTTKTSVTDYSEKWTFYSNGLFKTENYMYGTWKQRGKTFSISLYPEYVSKYLGIRLGDVLSYSDIADPAAKIMSFTAKENKKGKIKGRYKTGASFGYEGVSGKITIENKFTGMSEG